MYIVHVEEKGKKIKSLNFGWINVAPKNKCILELWDMICLFSLRLISLPYLIQTINGWQLAKMKKSIPDMPLS